MIISMMCQHHSSVSICMCENHGHGSSCIMLPPSRCNIGWVVQCLVGCCWQCNTWRAVREFSCHFMTFLGGVVCLCPKQLHAEHCAQSVTPDGSADGSGGYTVKLSKPALVKVTAAVYHQY